MDQGGAEMRNPLQNSLILEKIFGFVLGHRERSIDGKWKEWSGAKDILSCRLVNKTWKYSATRIIQKLTNPKYLSRYTSPSNINEWTADMNRFVNTMKNSDLIPISTYFVGINFSCKRSVKVASKFIELTFPDALELSFNFIWSKKMYPVSLVKANLVKLKALEFDCIVNSEKTFVLEWMAEILRAAPNLNEFRGRFGYSCQSEEGEKLMVELLTNVPATIKILSLNLSSASNLLFNALIEKKLNLQECRLAIPNLINFKFKDAFRTFLQGQTATLKFLCVPQDALALFPSFPPMKELTHLEFDNLTGVANPDEDMDLKSFPVIFPKLSSLNARKVTFKYVKILLSGNYVAEKVEELYFPDVGNSFISSLYCYDFRLMAKFSRGFANAKKIHLLGLENSSAIMMLREALCNFSSYSSRKFEELTVGITCSSSAFRSLDLDSALSGIPEDRIARVLNEDRLDNVDLERLRTGGSISQFSGMRKLVLSFNEKEWIRNGTTLFFEFSAPYLFARMTSLEELIIFGAVMSVNCVDVLKIKLKVLRVHVLKEDNTLELITKNYRDR